MPEIPELPQGATPLTVKGYNDQPTPDAFQLRQTAAETVVALAKALTPQGPVRTATLANILNQLRKDVVQILQDE